MISAGRLQLVRPCAPFSGDPKQFLGDWPWFGKSDLSELGSANPQKAYLVKALNHMLALGREGGAALPGVGEIIKLHQE